MRGVSPPPDRLKTIVGLITRAYVTTAPGQLPDEQEIEIIARFWAEVLAPVPDRYLPAAYQAALRAHSKSDGCRFPLTAAEILGAWEVNAETFRAEVRAALPPPARPLLARPTPPAPLTYETARDVPNLLRMLPRHFGLPWPGWALQQAIMTLQRRDPGASIATWRGRFALAAACDSAPSFASLVSRVVAMLPPDEEALL